MAGTNTNNKIKTTVELDVSQVQRQIVRLNGSASDTTKKLEDRIRDKNRAVELQNKLSKKVIDGLKKENASLIKSGASIKEVTASTKKLNAEKLKSVRTSAANTKQLNKLNASTKKSTKGFGAFSKSMGGAVKGGNLLKVAVVAAAAAFVLVIKKGAEFAKALSSLEAVSGATGREMKEMSTQAKELGASTAFTASEVVSLQTELAKLGNSASDIQKSTPAILNLAASLEIGLADAAAFAGSTVNAFGLEASDTQRVVDVMAESAASSAQDFSTLRESFVKAAPAASALGVSVEKTSALLGVLADSGIKGGLAGTALKNSFIELKKAGLTLEEGLAKVANSSDKLGTAIELAGKIGGPALLILSKNGDGIERLENKLNGAAGAAERMAEVKLNNLSGDVTKLQSAFEGFVLGLFSGTGALNDFLRSIVQGASSVLNFFTSTASVTEAFEEQRVSLFGVKAELDRYDEAIKSSTSSEEEAAEATSKRSGLIQQLQKDYPGYLKNIDLEKVTTEELKGAIDLVNASLINKIILQEEDEKLADQNKDTADALRDKLDDQAEAQDKANRALKEFGDIANGIQSTDPEGVLEELIKLQEEQTEIRKLGNKEADVSFSLNSKLNSQIRTLRNAVDSATSSEADYSEELGKSNSALEKRRELSTSLGLDEEAEPVETDAQKKIREKKEADEAQDEANRVKREEAKVARAEAKVIADKKAAAAEVKRKADVVKLKADIVKKQEDLDADTDIKKVELDRERHLAKLDALGLEGDEKLEQKIKIDAIYNEKLKTIKDKADEEEDALKLEKQALDRENQFELDELEIQRKKDLGERTLELELQLLIRKRDQELLIAGDDAKKKLIIEKKYSKAKDTFQKIAADAEQKRKDDLLNAGIAAAGEAFGIGKELSIATALVNTYKGISEVWSAKSETDLVGAGFAQKVATSAITAVQGFNTVKQIIATKGPSGGGSGGPGPAPTPAPAPVSAPVPVGISNVSDVAGSNASRLGTDSSLSSRASSDAVNGAQLSGNSSRVVFSENAYSDFQNQVQFREDRTTISG
jgi:hypothetical protein